MILTHHFILYVKDQALSTEFYSKVLDSRPQLNVPGMTEFLLTSGCILGLMPTKGIKRLLNDQIPDPLLANSIPRAELYLLTDNAGIYINRALASGARLLSPLLNRDWGHRAAYLLDHDNHIIAIAEVIGK